MNLTTAQCQFFTSFGYLVIRQMFSATEIQAITDGFVRSIDEFGGGRRHDGTRRTMFGGPIEHLPAMCSILDDPRILGLIGGVLGNDFNYCGGDGNYYSGETAWHPDGDWGQLFACKVAFYLDPVTKDSGCLRVVPGSHDPGHPYRARKLDPNRTSELMGVEPRDLPGHVALETLPGDIVMFNHDTWHASYGGGKQRKMFTMNCTRRYRTPLDLAQFKSYMGYHSAGGYKVDIGGMFFEPMLKTASQARMVHLEQAMAIHDELFPQFSRRRSHAEQVENMIAVMGHAA